MPLLTEKQVRAAGRKALSELKAKGVRFVTRQELVDIDRQSEELYYVQPDGKWALGGDARSEGKTRAQVEAIGGEFAAATKANAMSKRRSIATRKSKLETAAKKPAEIAATAKLRALTKKARCELAAGKNIKTDKEFIKQIAVNLQRVLGKTMSSKNEKFVLTDNFIVSKAKIIKYEEDENHGFALLSLPFKLDKETLEYVGYGGMSILDSMEENITTDAINPTFYDTPFEYNGHYWIVGDGDDAGAFTVKAKSVEIWVRWFADMDNEFAKKGKGKSDGKLVKGIDFNAAETPLGEMRNIEAEALEKMKAKLQKAAAAFCKAIGTKPNRVSMDVEDDEGRWALQADVVTADNIDESTADMLEDKYSGSDDFAITVGGANSFTITYYLGAGIYGR